MAADQEELTDLVARVAGQAADGEEVEAYASRGRSTTVRVHGGEVESLTQAAASGIGIRVVTGGRQGFAWAGSLDPDVVATTLAEARDNAAFAEVDEFAGLAAPDGVPVPVLDLHRPDVVALPTASKVDFALDLERAVRAGDPRIRGVRTSAYGDSIGEAAVATSTGIAAWGEGTICNLSVMALASDGDETQVGYGVSIGRAIADLDVDEAAAEAVDKATRMLGARKAPSGRVTVVLEPRVAASILGIVGGTLNGEAVLKGRSLFADRLGEQVAAPWFTLVDDPTEPSSLGAARPDGEGLAGRRNPLIDGGVLQCFLHNTWSGRRSGAASTGSAVRGYRSTPGVGAHALGITPGTLGFEALLAEVGDGLLVQSVTGLHSGVNPVSGDVSIGAEGLMIRGGATAEPVREVTIASTLPRMLLDVAAVGSDLEWTPGGTGAASLAIANITLSGS